MGYEPPSQREEDEWALLDNLRRENEELRAQLAVATARADKAETDARIMYEQATSANARENDAIKRTEAAEAIADNMLNHLLPDTIRAIVLDLSAAEHRAPDSGEFALLPETLKFRDKCAAFLGAEWPSSAWDQEWLTALDAEKSRRQHEISRG